MPLYHPGDAVPSRCTRCNDVTGHVIVALVGGEIVKVECRACGSVHKYRAPERPKAEKAESPQRVRQGASRTEAIQAVRAAKPAQSAERTSKPATPKRAIQAALDMERSWEKAVATAPGAAQLYSMQASFALGDLIDHPTFGNGIVRELLPPDKVRVLFRDGLRLLRCAC